MIIHTTGLPAIGDYETLLAAEYFYLIGATAPRYKLPTIITQNYVLASEVSRDSGLLVIWFLDGAIAV